MATTLPQIDTRTVWVLNPMHSQIEFSVKHLMITTVKGYFTGMQGKIVGGLENPANNTVELEVDAASVNTCNEQRDVHLRTADFLDVETYPTITFKSTSVLQEGQNTFKVIGDMTLHGVTREVVLDTTVNGLAKDPLGGGEVVGISAVTTVDRRDFGVSLNIPLEGGGWALGNDIRIAVEIEAVKEICDLEGESSSMACGCLD